MKGTQFLSKRRALCAAAGGLVACLCLAQRESWVAALGCYVAVGALCLGLRALALARIGAERRHYRWTTLAAVPLALLLFAKHDGYQQRWISKEGEVRDFRGRWENRVRYRRIDFSNGELRGHVEGPINSAGSRHGRWLGYRLDAATPVEVWFFNGAEISKDEWLTATRF